MTGNFLHHRLADPHNVHKHAMRQFEMNHLGGHAKVEEQKKKKQSALKLQSAVLDTGEKPPPPVHDLAGLSCSDHGGPSDDLAKEMIYWSDIPSDDAFVSPIGANSKKRKYLTFEPDGGGFNNIRMSMETMIVMAHAMSRTLVMPPSQGMYLLRKGSGKKHFSFDDFYHLEQVGYEHAGLHVISMEEFLKTEAMTGNLFNKTTGDAAFPPNNRTNWDGIDPKPLKEYLRDVTLTPLNWTPGSCLVAFPSDDGPEHFAELDEMMKEVNANFPRVQEFVNKPVPVNAPATERLREAVAGQVKQLCVYDEKMQDAPVVHFMCYHKMRVRFLTHFYAFLFFESWEQDLFNKRFVRDHLRYADEIQCAAARVVAAIRDRARRRDPTGNPNGDFDSFHIRRVRRRVSVDEVNILRFFQYKATRLEADQIYENTKDELQEKATVFVATDHQGKPFFKPLADHYDLVFLSDFKEELKDANTNYLGMIDQLVASRGRVFFGCFHSTFSGFIFRMRGYHSQKEKVEGWDQGILPKSYYYSGKHEKSIYQSYGPLRTPYFSREFPISWRDIDKGVEELSAFGV
eukprot:scaffold10417_cov137-Skeletonema_marinoi.AAC.19